MADGYVLSEDFLREVRKAVRHVLAQERNESNRFEGRRNPLRLQSFPFQMTAALTPGGSVTGKRLEWDSDANDYQVTGDSQTFYDDGDGDFTGYNGARGRYVWDHGERIIVQAPRALVGISNGSIGARSGSTPGSGSMTIHDGDLSSVGNTITVWNNTATAITTGKYMQAKVAAGKLWADVVECST